MPSSSLFLRLCTTFVSLLLWTSLAHAQNGPWRQWTPAQVTTTSSASTSVNSTTVTGTSVGTTEVTFTVTQTSVTLNPTAPGGSVTVTATSLTVLTQTVTAPWAQWTSGSSTNTTSQQWVQWTTSPAVSPQSTPQPPTSQPASTAPWAPWQTNPASGSFLPPPNNPTGTTNNWQPWQTPNTILTVTVEPSAISSVIASMSSAGYTLANPSALPCNSTASGSYPASFPASSPPTTVSSLPAWNNWTPTSSFYHGVTNTNTAPVSTWTGAAAAVAPEAMNWLAIGLGLGFLV